MKQNNNKQVQCIYCGNYFDQSEITKDHIPPKNIFRKPRPNNLITVPCCSGCHSKTTQDDEYFRLNVVMKDENPSKPEVTPLYEAILRGLKRGKSKGFKKDWLNRQFLTETYSPTGIFSGYKHKYNVDLSRLDKVVERTVAGIISHESGSRLPNTHQINVFSVSGLNMLRLESRNSLDENIKKLLNTPYYYIGSKEIFSFWRSYCDNTLTSFWLLAFFESTFFVATVVPKNT
ncbi:HNH endonuclease [Desulfoluna spongiiphila]|uniref:HNH endonuclease n=1 Tax=Desulfoluna spongiiphila TaxID=419481 RepID=A0A1G5FZ45_9BACT|nr:HNH endonuclease [Desulfoluna spongiiphila]SCY44441.1 HNH endonuclease [Desulfoluna spongiiphila]